MYLVRWHLFSIVVRRIRQTSTIPTPCNDDSDAHTHTCHIDVAQENPYMRLNPSVAPCGVISAGSDFGIFNFANV